jgi:hypothetical protein
MCSGYFQEARAGISSNVFHGVLVSSVISAYRNRALICGLPVKGVTKWLAQHRWEFHDVSGLGNLQQE